MRSRMAGYCGLLASVVSVICVLLFRRGEGSAEWAEHSGMVSLCDNVVAALLWTQSSGNGPGAKKRGLGTLGRLPQYAVQSIRTHRWIRRLLVTSATIVFCSSLFPVVLLTSPHQSAITVSVVGGYALGGTFLCGLFLFAVFSREGRWS